MEALQTRIGNYLDMAIEYSPKLLLAIIVILIGLRIIRWVTDRIEASLTSSEMEPAVRGFLLSMISILLKVLLFFSAAEIVGIKTASFLAILAAAGFALGMALQGSLGNFAAGVMIIFFKPYRIGDIIEVADMKGKVSDIQIFNTVLVTPKNETVIIPNATAIADKIINHSTIGNERVDVFFHIPYAQDFSQVKTIVHEYLQGHERILKDPEPRVSIEEYDSHNIKVGVFSFAHPDDYWKVFYDVSDAIKPLLGKHGIKVAYSEGVELGTISDA